MSASYSLVGLPFGGAGAFSAAFLASDFVEGELAAGRAVAGARAGAGAAVMASLPSSGLCSRADSAIKPIAKSTTS